MATTDQVLEEVLLLSRYLWRGPTGHAGPPLEGMVPDIQRQITNLTSWTGNIHRDVIQTATLLKAVNEETLGRIESLIKAVNEETLGRIESQIRDIREFLGAINEETLGRIETKLDGLKTDIEQESARLHLHLDEIEKAIATPR